MAYVIFSKRQHMYPSETIPDELRFQVLYIWEKVWEKARYDDYFGVFQLSDLARDAYNLIEMTLREEYGVGSLVEDNDSDGQIDDLYQIIYKFLFETKNTDKVIDIIEVSFRYIDIEVRDKFYGSSGDEIDENDELDKIFGISRPEISHDGISPDEAIDLLNERFLEHGVGYKYESAQNESAQNESAQIVKVDSPDSHSGEVKPAEELPNNTQQAMNNSPMNNDCGIHTTADNTTGRETLTEGYPIMQIEITGYVTQTHGKDGFTIKVTCDAVQSLSFRNIQISREVRVFMRPYYPSETNNVFQEIPISQWDNPRNHEIDESRSISNALRMGDRVKCSVFIVETETHNRQETFVINRNRKDIEAYADFPLWLYPDPQLFKRLEVDSRESLKFRKQWFYTCLNREKCEEITGDKWNKYRDKPWINKNPKIIFPIIWGIRVKTAISNLWERLIGQGRNKLAIISLVATILFGIISLVVGVWF